MWMKNFRNSVTGVILGNTEDPILIFFAMWFYLSMEMLVMWKYAYCVFIYTSHWFFLPFNFFRPPVSKVFTTLLPQTIILSPGTSFSLPITFHPLKEVWYPDWLCPVCFPVFWFVPYFFVCTVLFLKILCHL